MTGNREKMREAFDRESDRVEQGTLRAMRGDLGGPRVRAALEAFDKRMSAVESMVDTVWGGAGGDDPFTAPRPSPREAARRARQNLSRLRQPLASADALPSPRLDNLSVLALHKLEKLVADLAQTVSGGALQTLRILMEMAPARGLDPSFTAKLDAAAAKLPELLARAEAWFDHDVERGARVRDLFASEAFEARLAVNALVALPGVAEQPAPGVEWRDVDPGDAMTAVDRLAWGLETMRRRLDERRVDLAEIVHGAFVRLRETEDAEGVDCLYQDTSEGRLRAFADGEALRQAVSETIRSALGRLKGGEAPRTLFVRVEAVAGERGREGVIHVQDSGRPLDAAEVERFGREGSPSLREVVEVRHGGRIEITSAPAEGTQVSLRAPVKLADVVGRA